MKVGLICSFKSDAKLEIQNLNVSDLPLSHWSTSSFIEKIRVNSSFFVSYSFVWTHRATNRMVDL